MPHVLVGLVNQAAIQFAEDNLQTCNPFLRAAAISYLDLLKEEGYTPLISISVINLQQSFFVHARLLNTQCIDARFLSCLAAQLHQKNINLSCNVD